MPTFTPTNIETFRRSVGRKLRTARNRVGLSQAEVARCLGLSDVGCVVGQWERGLVLPRLEHMRGLAKLYDVLIDELVP